ncbi:MAG: enoyl-CoA hydratase-related protein [Sphingomonadales bacterium]
MKDELVKLDIDGRGVATLTLNRPEVHNAFNDAVITRLSEIFAALKDDGNVRVVVVRASGKSFSAGADAKWMRSAAGYSKDRNMADAMRMGEMLRLFNFLPKPTIALVQGAALGGGVGLVSCCDIVIASRNAKFGLTEVRLGLTPATISPYVVAAIGSRHARRYFVTGERFDAETACEIGLVHEVADDHNALDEAGERIIGACLAGAPGAIADAKRLQFTVAGRPVDDELMVDTARYIAEGRASAEGKEGLAAFLEKRRPGWAS